MADYERQLLRSTVAEYLAAGGGVDLRGHADLGLYGIALPENVGGGGSVLDAAVVAVEKGRWADFSEYAGTVGLACALSQAGVASSPALTELLTEVAAGRTQLVALGSVPGSPGSPSTRFVRRQATVPVVGVWKEAGLTEGAVLCRWQELETFCEPRRVVTTANWAEYSVDLSTVAGPVTDAEEVVVGPGVWEYGERIVSGLIGAEIVGACRWLIADSRGFAVERVQFGKSIGSFQAIQHQIVDMLAWTEAAELLVTQAINAADTTSAGEYMAVAISFLYDRAWECIQGGYNVLGGVGFIEEHQINRYSRGILGLVSQLNTIAELRIAAAANLGRSKWFESTWL